MVSSAPIPGSAGAATVGSVGGGRGSEGGTIGSGAVSGAGVVPYSRTGLMLDAATTAPTPNAPIAAADIIPIFMAREVLALLGTGVFAALGSGSSFGVDTGSSASSVSYPPSLSILPRTRRTVFESSTTRMVLPSMGEVRLFLRRSLLTLSDCPNRERKENPFMVCCLPPVPGDSILDQYETNDPVYGVHYQHPFS